MVKSHQFWVGFVLGIVAYLAYVLFAMWLLFGRRSASASSGTEALV